MDNNLFIEFCKDKFHYLVDEFGFNDATFEDDGIRLHILYEKKGYKLEIINHSIEMPEYPIAVYFITVKKSIFKKTNTYALDDLLIYRKCNSQVYEYLDYNNINTFYDKIPEEKLDFYKDKYSSDEEIKLIIDKYSRILKEFGADILKENIEVLPNVKKLREEYDRKFGCSTIYN
ncbi:hypothetical protein CSC2_37030 [Clostridium zeae]|uniref:DUF4304 domain-containing protein n=1 Tax=Clostridium zeae TaxID=2759022 RepID=A0ABQ1EEG7_9CLOT|nr:hypothetical protein [Clostridium zeae]GFZ33177.1 hypothetical protein CSC2_37030 [Clostridium zeae]